MALKQEGQTLESSAGDAFGPGGGGGLRRWQRCDASRLRYAAGVV